MNLSKLTEILKNEPGFRLRQINDQIFKNLITDWDKATNLSKNLREKLKKEISLDIDAKLFSSKNSQSHKALLTLSDNQKIETVLLMHSDKRNTVCVSSQIGCPLNCAFCNTGKLGFVRNLSKDEILLQLLFFQRFLKSGNKKITNVVFMGMGEPFLNYEAVMAAIEKIHNPDCFNIGYRNISISTAGIITGITRLINEKKEINLAISLHSVSDEKRSELMPINQNNPIKELLKTGKKYIDSTNRKLMIEYLLIDKINDSPKDAFELAKILKQNLKHLFFVNLIPFNPIDSNFKTAALKNIQQFKKILEKSGIFTTQRYEFAKDINAACGQLAAKEEKK